LQDRVGEWYGNFTHHMLRHLHSVRGNISGELAESEFELATGTASGDMEFFSYGLYGKAGALARAGRTEEALPLVDRSVEILLGLGSAALAIAYGAQGYVRLQASDYAGARESVERSRKTVFRTHVPFEWVGLTFPILVESLLGPKWSNSDGGPTRAVARKARREARFARFFGWRFPNYGPHALRVSGRAAYALGKTKKARRYFERAIVAAEQHGARYDLARALLDASRVIPDCAVLYRSRGLRLLGELGAVVPEAERFFP
jgi:tetratricopeptide (TPR) repeat protein